MKTVNIIFFLSFGASGIGWFQLRVSHEAAVKMMVRTVVTSASVCVWGVLENLFPRWLARRRIGTGPQFLPGS